MLSLRAVALVMGVNHCCLEGHSHIKIYYMYIDLGHIVLKSQIEELTGFV